MEELLSKIYDRIVIYEKDCISLGTEFDQKVAEKLEPMKESISEDELEKLKELIYWAAFLEEKDGFRLGVKFTEYYGAAEPPVRCGESHLSGLTEPPTLLS